MRVSDTDVSDKLTGKFVKCVNLYCRFSSFQKSGGEIAGVYPNIEHFAPLILEYIKEPVQHRRRCWFFTVGECGLVRGSHEREKKRAGDQ